MHHVATLKAMIHQFTRETKAEVLQLVAAGGAAVTESKALLRSYRMLERAVEEPDRVMWLVEQAARKRGTRPLHSRDAIDLLLRAEKAAAKKCKHLLIQRYAAAKSMTRELKQRRAVLQALVDTKRIGLHLNADATAGAVEGAAFPLPLDWGPPCVRLLAECYTRSVQLRGEVAASLAQCSELMAGCRSASEAAIKESIQRGKDLQREVLIAKAETRLADAQARRNQHRLEINHLKHLGPERSSDRTVAEKHARPLVQTYGRADGHRQGEITALETADLAKEWLENNIRQTKNDRDVLAHSEAKLNAAIHDIRQTKHSDVALRNFRGRFSPSKRVGGNV
jgi:hypothetical protein